MREITMTELVDVIRLNPESTSKEIAQITGGDIIELRKMIRELTERFIIHFDKSAMDANRYKLSKLDKNTTKGKLVSQRWTSDLVL